MAAYCVFGFLNLLCYFLLLLSAAAEEDCPESSTCGYLGKIHVPFTTSPKKECGLHISGCETEDDIKELHLKNQRYEIVSIYQDDKYNSIFIHNPTAAEIDSEDTPLYTLYSNTINFSICSHSSFNPETKNMIKRPCPSHDIYYSYTNLDPRLPSILSFACLLSGPKSSESCVPSTSFLIINVNLKPCVDGTNQCQQNKSNPPEAGHNTSNPPDAETNGKERHLKAAVIGLSVGLATVITIASFAIVFLFKRTNQSSGILNQSRNTYSGPYRGISNPESRAVYFGIPVFSYEELQQATNNFDEARQLGEGGFGTVYYGKLRDGREVAVKRFFERNYRPVESFNNEIQILTRMRHKFLVSLYGCTSRHSRELLLVYEYAPNGALSCHLHGDKAKNGILPWPVRMRIAIETASALTYLHASDIIHRDVKSSNILLDNYFCVKVADFGLSRLFPNDVTHVSTAPKGTPGYVDPDYRLCYQLTTKSDVYSFGVVLVELISSMPAVDMSRDRDEIKLANLAVRRIQRRAFYELIDPSLGFQLDDKLKRTIISVAELAFQCLQEDKESRPSMSEVLEVLQRIESEKAEPLCLEGIEIQGSRVPERYTHPSLPNMTPQRHHQTV